MAVIQNRVSLLVQAGALKSYLPSSVIVRDKEKSLSWICTLRPTPLSLDYTVKVEYIRGKGVSAYVIDPKPLPLAKGEDELPHTYSTPEQELCLYYPGYREWHPGLLYTRTIVPWIVEWLYFYEIWLGGNGWQGGGIDHGKDVVETTDNLSTRNPSQG